MSIVLNEDIFLEFDTETQCLFIVTLGLYIGWKREEFCRTTCTLQKDGTHIHDYKFIWPEEEDAIWNPETYFEDLIPIIERLDELDHFEEFYFNLQNVIRKDNEMEKREFVKDSLIMLAEPMQYIRALFMMRTIIIKYIEENWDDA